MKFRDEKVDDAGKSSRVIGAPRDNTEPKRADRTMRERERRTAGSAKKYRSIIDGAGDAIFIVDVTDGPDGNFDDVNKAACESLGYSRDELLGMSVTDVEARLTDPEREAARRAMSKSEVRTLRGDHRRKDGTTFPVSIRYSLFEFGGRRYSMSLVRDETERENTEQALLESESRFRDFASTAADRFWEIDGDLRHTYISPPAGNLRRPVAELIGKSIFDIVALGNGPEELREFRDFIENHLAFKDWHHRWRAEDGKTVYVRISGTPVFDDRGVFKGYRGTSKDETAEVMARIDADKNRGRFNDAIESFPDGFVLWDAEQRFVACNHFYRKTHESVGDDLRPGVKFADMLHRTAQSGRVEGAIGREKEWVRERLLEQKKPTSEIFRLGRWMLITRNRLPNGGTLEFHSDITDFKQKEADLQNARMEAEAASQAKSEFLANMSHELRTPLNAVIGFSEALKGEIFGPMANAEQAEYIDTIHFSGTHLRDLINDILDLSAVEAGKVVLNEVELEISSLTAYAVQIMKSQALKDGIRISDKTERTLPKIFADERKFKQIMVNLISNAVKFTRDGGEVTLTAETSEDGSLCIKVTDTGIGMDADGLATALEKFGQVDNDLSRDDRGTGLGLPLTKGLIEAHGGRLEFTSSPGAGTEVTICIPRERVRA